MSHKPESRGGFPDGYGPLSSADLMVRAVTHANHPVAPEFLRQFDRAPLVFTEPFVATDSDVNALPAHLALSERPIGQSPEGEARTPCPHQAELRRELGDFCAEMDRLLKAAWNSQDETEDEVVEQQQIRTSKQAALEQTLSHVLQGGCSDCLQTFTDVHDANPDLKELLEMVMADAFVHSFDQLAASALPLQEISLNDGAWFSTALEPIPEDSQLDGSEQPQ